jgi:hypothetical protein|tara:strand:+ start:137 stop:277 length:141 start_codon:yes stop_codon:yes gene_type:complete
MIKKEITIKGIKYTVKAKTLEILEQTIKDLKRLNRKNKKDDAISEE